MWQMHAINCIDILWNHQSISYFLSIQMNSKKSYIWRNVQLWKCANVSIGIVIVYIVVFYCKLASSNNRQQILREENYTGNQKKLAGVSKLVRGSQPFRRSVTQFLTAAWLARSISRRIYTHTASWALLTNCCCASIKYNLCSSLVSVIIDICSFTEVNF